MSFSLFRLTRGSPADSTTFVDLPLKLFILNALPRPSRRSNSTQRLSGNASPRSRVRCCFLWLLRSRLLTFRSFVQPTEHERYIKKIEDAEARREKDERQSALIKRKVASSDSPLQLLKIKYQNQTKGKSYSEDEDRFLLVSLAKYGVGKEDTFDLIKRDIATFPAFRFNWYFKSRSPQEIGRRCSTLGSLIEKEFEDEAQSKAGGAAKGKGRASTGAAASNGNGNGAAAGGSNSHKKRKVEDVASNASGSRASTPVGKKVKVAAARA